MSSDKHNRNRSGRPNRMGEARNHETEGQPEALKPHKKSFGIEISILAIGVAAIVMYLLLPTQGFSGLWGGDKSAQNILVLDAVAIEHAKKAQLQESISDYAEVLREAQLFNRDLYRIVTAYKDSGAIVLNRHAVIAMPDAIDITSQVARELNVALPDLAR